MSDLPEPELCGKPVGRHVATKEMRYCGLLKNHETPWCVTAEAIEYVAAKRAGLRLTHGEALRPGD